MKTLIYLKLLGIRPCMSYHDIHILDLYMYCKCAPQYLQFHTISTKLSFSQKKLMIFHFDFDLNTVDLNVLNNQFIVIPISPAQVIISPQKFTEVKSLRVSISFDLLN